MLCSLLIKYKVLIIKYIVKNDFLLKNDGDSSFCGNFTLYLQAQKRNVNN